ncbi:hypothetical protein, partial [Croceicoccus bisphenolivorans]|uniref:hypothetical protein n=1 Tax=Croceicoccus bisphenolivorans TaxID=1783232 RepID=UPI000B2680E0
ELSGDEYIAGNPAEVAEQIIEQCRTIGAAHFMAMLDGHGNIAANAEAFDLFGEQVNPLLRKAGNSVSTQAVLDAVQGS